MTSWCEHFSACAWTHEKETYDSMMIRGGGGGGGGGELMGKYL